MTRSENDGHDGLNISKFAILGIKSAAAFSKWINENLFINISPDGEQYSQVKILSNDDMRVLNDKENFLPILRMIDPSIDDFKLDNKSPFTGTVIVNVLHLNLENYMNEQIYFVTKNVHTLQFELYHWKIFRKFNMI